MSIASEISRLQTAKADIKTAIEAKGVTVPSSATLDDYDTYVSQITTGGGTNYLEQYANKSLSGTITSAQIGTNIGNKLPKYFLYGMSNITSIDFSGTGVTSIPDNFMQYCSNMTSISNFPSSVTSIGAEFCKNSGITSFTIPSTLTTIGTYFLQGNPITSITVPSTVTSLGNDAFNGCNRLTTLIFNAPISNPNQSLCNNTSSLALVDLNSSVSNIRAYSFAVNSTNTNLLEVVLRKTDAIVTVANTIGSTSYNAAFRNRRNIKVYVPSTLKASYEADANWAAGITAGYLTFVNLEGSDYE